MLALVLGPPPAHMTYCHAHQRAWVASLDRWVAFHVPTRDGSPVTDTPCDHCAVGYQRVKRVGGHCRGSGVRAEHDNGDEVWSAAAQGTHDPW